MSLLRCPLCAGPLERREGSYRCPAGHSFDVAKEGYVHLLPPNRKHSALPGDDREMVLARRAFLSKGYYQPLLNTVCNQFLALPEKAPVILDAGCGEGWYTRALGSVIARKGGRTAGVDLSKPAVKKAARRCPDGEFAVASVYHLPAADGCTDVLVDCFAPLAAAEYARVLRPGGTFLYVVPGPRHLWELKEILYETPYENEERREEYPGFRYVDVVPVEFRFTLPDRENIRDLLGMTPYFWRTPPNRAARLESLERLEVTGQFRIHVMERVVL